MLRTVIHGVVATMLASVPVLAQTGTITGRVMTAENAQPVANAQVIVVGTGAGAITRNDGRYTLTVRAGRYTVRALRIGFNADSVTNVVVPAGGTATADFHLRSAPTALSGIVVVGYGTQEAKDVTGSVVAIDTMQFNTGRIVSPEALIRGKVAGVQVSDNNEPGGGVVVRIRGGTSVNASNEPLYVIDGVPIDVGGGSTVSGRNGLNFLNPNDIETVTVLKDASATAIYGNRGANGVIIITTKSGASQPQVMYSGNFSGSRVVGGPDMLTAEQYRAAVAQFAPTNVSSLGTANTDWLAAIEQNAGGQEHNLDFAGRRDAALYRLGLGYLDQEGVLIGTRTRRASGSINYSDLLLGDRLALHTHLRGSRSVDDYTPSPVLGEAVAFAPTQPIYTTAGSYYQYRDPTSGNLIGLAPNNPIEDLKFLQDQGIILRSIGSVEGEYRLPWLEGLSVTGRGSFDSNRADRNSFTPSSVASQLKGDPTLAGNVSRANHSELHTVLDAFATYRHNVGVLDRGSADLTAGVSGENFDGSYNGYAAKGLSTNLLGFDGVPSFKEASPGVSVQQHRLRSQFARANLSFKDRYLFTGTVRRDGSSRFGPDQQWGVFPSAAFAWRMGEEPSLKEHLPVSDLKLRVSWGKNGNESIGCNYCAYGSYEVGGPQAQAQLGNSFITTIRPIAFDPNLHWETTTSTDVGIDFGFLQNRFSASIDGYTKTTDDLLFAVPTAAGTALSNSVLTNIGSVRNRGFELMLDGKLVDGGRKGLSWLANFNVSHNSNELLTLGRPGLTSISTGGIAGGVGTNIQVLQPGQPVNSFYVYQHREANGKVVVTGPDTAMYVDVNKDGIINTSDLRPFHSPAPRWILGHTSNVNWRNFDASTTLRAYIGNYVYNNVASNLGNYSVLTSPYAPANLSASVLQYGFTRPQYLSDLYVEDASFLRMDNLTVGYTFDHLGQVRNPRVFGTIQNVFTTTGYSGVDPTANINGIDNNVYPRSRTFVGGVTIGF